MKPKLEMSITDVGKILTACEVLEKYFGATGATWLGRIFFFADKDSQSRMQKFLDTYNAFYALPFEERLIKVGFKKNKKGNMEKTIEL